MSPTARERVIAFLIGFTASLAATYAGMMLGW